VEYLGLSPNMLLNPKLSTNKHELNLTLKKRMWRVWGFPTCHCAHAKSKASKLYKKYSWLRFKTASTWAPSKRLSKHRSWSIKAWPTSWTSPANPIQSAKNTLNTWTSRSRTTSRRTQRSILESQTVSSKNVYRREVRCLFSRFMAKAGALLLFSHTW